VLLALSIVGTRAAKLPFQTAEKTNFAHIPMNLDKYTGVNQDFGEATRLALPSASLLARDYSLPNESKISLAIVYAVDLGEFHQPEYCLEGDGIRPVQKGIVSIKGRNGDPFDAVSLITESDFGKDAFIYWFTSEGITSTSLGNYKMRIFMDRLRGKPLRPSALVRVSAAVKDNDVNSALEDLKRFAEKLVPCLDEEFRSK